MSSSLFRWEAVRSGGMWNGSVLSFSRSQRRVLCSNGKRFSLLGCGTDVFFLFRCNNDEFSVQMGNGSVCWAVERMRFVFFDTSSSLFRWETARSVGMWNGSVLFVSM